MPDCRNRGGRGTVCWNGVLRGRFLGIKMQYWNTCLSSILYDFASFWITYLNNPESKRCLEKAKNYQNLASFDGSYIDGIICVKQNSLGSARTWKKYVLKKYMKKNSDFNFTVCTSWFLGKVRIKTYSNTNPSSFWQIS